MGLFPLENNATSLSNYSQNKPTTPIIEINTLKRCDHINSDVPTVKKSGKI